MAELLTRTPHGYNLNQFANTEKSLDFFDASPDLAMNIANEVFKLKEKEKNDNLLLEEKTKVLVELLEKEVEELPER